MKYKVDHHRSEYLIVTMKSIETTNRALISPRQFIWFICAERLVFKADLFCKEAVCSSCPSNIPIAK